MDIYTIGGYSEVGKNMTAVRVGDDVVILDIGFHLPRLIDFEEEGGDRRSLNRKSMIQLGAAPDDKILKKLRKNVRAIALGHCHLDHIGAVPYLCNEYPNATIMGTPYTIEILNTMIADERMTVNNKVRTTVPNSSLKVGKDIKKIEFIGITHSTLQCCLMAVHTKEGIVLYANDFKFDNNPVLGKKPDYKRLRQLGKENVRALIVESIYACEEMKTPSENVAREMLKDVIMGTDSRGHAIVATTFASHIARLKSLYDFGSKLGRKVVFIGRSMAKYISAAEKLKLIKFSDNAEIIGYSNKIKKKLNKIIEEGKDKYFIVCTGGQGEPGSVMSRMLKDDYPFQFERDDHVIFSNKIIPCEENLANRALLEDKLRKRGVRMFKDIHTSGHSGREDLRDLIYMVNPKHIIPAHGDVKMRNSLSGLSIEMGYEDDKTVHSMSNGDMISI